MTHSFTVSDIIPATPREVFNAWLDSKAHGKMTGGKANTSAEIGAEFTAWDGYITGTNLELEVALRIVQSWRTSEFADGDPPSMIELTLEPEAGGTRLTIKHTNIPNDQSDYKQGWRDNYFEPMKEYFSTKG